MDVWKQSYKYDEFFEIITNHEETSNSRAPCYVFEPRRAIWDEAHPGYDRKYFLLNEGDASNRVMQNHEMAVF